MSFNKMSSAELFANARGSGSKKRSLVEVNARRKSNLLWTTPCVDVVVMSGSTDFTTKSTCLDGTSCITTNSYSSSILVALIFMIFLLSPMVQSSICCVIVTDRESPMSRTRCGAASRSRLWINSSQIVVRRNQKPSNLYNEGKTISSPPHFTDNIKLTRAVMVTFNTLIIWCRNNSNALFIQCSNASVFGARFRMTFKYLKWFEFHRERGTWYQYCTVQPYGVVWNGTRTGTLNTGDRIYLMGYTFKQHQQQQHHQQRH